MSLVKSPFRLLKASVFMVNPEVLGVESAPHRGPPAVRADAAQSAAGRCRSQVHGDDRGGLEDVPILGMGWTP